MNWPATGNAYEDARWNNAGPRELDAIEARRNAAERKAVTDLVWKRGLPYSRLTRRRVHSAKNDPDPDARDAEIICGEIERGYVIARGWKRTHRDDEPANAPCAWCGNWIRRGVADNPLCRRCVSVEVAERKRAETGDGRTRRAAQ